MLTVTLVHAVTIKIVVTDVIVTVTVTIIGGMECEPEMKVNKKDRISLRKNLHLIQEIKEVQARDQVLMLLFLLKSLNRK